MSLFIHSSSAQISLLDTHLGPSIAAAGLALLLPALMPKPLAMALSPELQAQLGHQYSIYSDMDQAVTIGAWIALVVLVGVWVWSLPDEL